MVQLFQQEPTRQLLLVAEASKVIENTQRDVNIGLINELALIFNHLGIDTEKFCRLLKQMELSFRAVSGNAESRSLLLDAQSPGNISPEIILSGRRLNDSMGEYVALQLVKAMLEKGTTIKGSRVLILGITFKENCPD